MSDFEKRILKNYQIDVREINLFKLYQISGDTVTNEELEAALSRCRQKWQSALNSPNERVVAPVKSIWRMRLSMRSSFGTASCAASCTNTTAVRKIRVQTLAMQRNSLS